MRASPSRAGISTRGPVCGRCRISTTCWRSSRRGAKSCRPEETVSAADQVLGVGDGVRARFGLVKMYGEGEDAYQRFIARPVIETLRVAVGGEEISPDGWSFDVETGEVVFEADSIPSEDAIVTAGYEFDVPVRFDTERLAVSLTSFKAGQIPSIPLIEVLA